jgi:hypothetical protein
MVEEYGIVVLRMYCTRSDFSKQEARYSGSDVLQAFTSAFSVRYSQKFVELMQRNGNKEITSKDIKRMSG